MNKISYSSLLDNQLVDKLINGDVKAYEEFFVRYYSHLRNFVNCIVKNYNLAEDISQNVFMKLWLFRSSINPTFSVKNWLFVMAKNEAINYFKKLKPVLLADLPIVETKIAEENILDPNEHNYVDLETSIMKQISKMPDQRQKIFLMSRYNALSNAEIANELSISIRTVEKHISLALQDLKKEFN